MNKSHSLIKICPICKKKFKTFFSQNNETCSKVCQGKYRTFKFTQYATRFCKVCGKSFIPKHTDKNKKHNLFCSVKCRSKVRIKPIIYRSGYRYIHLPNHPHASKQGYYAEHRYLMEKTLGRLLEKKEIVHHINHVKSDNKPKNLMLHKSSGKHFINEHFDGRRDSKGTFAS